MWTWDSKTQPIYLTQATDQWKHREEKEFETTLQVIKMKIKAIFISPLLSKCLLGDFCKIRMMNLWLCFGIAVSINWSQLRERIKLNTQFEYSPCNTPFLFTLPSQGTHTVGWIEELETEAKSFSQQAENFHWCLNVIINNHSAMALLTYSRVVALNHPNATTF